MKILILGGNGFIGSHIAAAAFTAGHEIVCLGRNIAHARHRHPEFEWLQADLSTITSPRQWASLLSGIDTVVNAAGALQDSARDRLDKTQQEAMLALYEAAKASPSLRIVQISANTGGPAKKTAFLATKRVADEALAASGIKHTILRPALVIGRNAHGGTALVRSIAGFPFFLPITFADAECQTCDIDDLAETVLRAADGEFGNASDMAVANKQTVSLSQIAVSHRNWLGLETGRVLRLPDWLAHIGSFFADIAGRFGWRSPLRSTALKVLQGGVMAEDSVPLTETRSLEETLRQNPASVQDLWFARLYLLKPVMILVLSVFWNATGIISLTVFPRTLELLTNAGFSIGMASVLAFITSLADIILGSLILFRRWAKWALWGMIALSISYLVSGTLLAPSYWLDPLGAYVKVLPSIVLAFATLAILDER